VDRLRSHLGTALIVVLVILDVVLVGLAERHSRHPSNAADSIPIRPFHVTPTGISPSPDPTITRPPTAPATPSAPGAKAPSAALLLSAANPQDAIEAHASCHAKPHLALTTDDGTTFKPVAAPAPHVLRVTAVSATSDWIVGANAACTPTYYSTANSGMTWSPSSTLGRVWVALPTGVHTPGNHVSAPCGHADPEPLALAPSGFADAIVVCQNGVHTTKNGGKTWSGGSTLPAGDPFAAALTAGGKGLVLLANAGTCDGVRIARTTDSGVTWTRGTCLKGVTAPAGVTLTAAGAGLISDPGTSYTTTDFGRTWS
jgi:photosystem II stability/assembly factor-like uncharacterized protein